MRVRNTAVETSPQSARDALLGVVEALKEVVASTPLDAQIMLHAVTPFPAVMQTTFAREVRQSCLIYRLHRVFIFAERCGAD